MLALSEERGHLDELEQMCFLNKMTFEIVKYKKLQSDLKILVRNSKSWKIFTNIKMIGYVKLKLIFQCRKCKLKHWLLRKATKNGMNNEVV